MRSLVDDLIQRAVSQSASTATNTGGTLSVGPEQKEGGIRGRAGVSGGSSKNELADTTNPVVGQESDADAEAVGEEESGSKSGTKSDSAACKLEWAGKGKVVCGRAPTTIGVTDPTPGAVGAGAGSAEFAEEVGLVDEAEVFRWKGAWEEAVEAVRSRDSGEIRRSRRPLFNPAQVNVYAFFHLK